MKKQETLFKERVFKKLKNYDRLWFYKTNDRTAKGIPDVILCANGHFIAVEFKCGANVPTAYQQIQLSLIHI